MIREIKFALFLMLLILMGVSTSAFADSYSWGYQSSNLNGNPVNAAVTVTTTLNGFDVSVVNLLSGAKTGQQTIGSIQLDYANGLSWTMKNNLNSALLQSSSGLQRTIKSDGTFTDSGPAETNWDLSNSAFSGGLALCASACNDLNPQAIIGDPNSSTGKYTGADSTITGSSYKPELVGTMDQPVTFHVYAAGVTSSTSVSSLFDGANFVFGDSYSGTVTKSGSQVSLNWTGGGNTPEPASIFLLGSGVLAIARKVRAKK